MRHTVHLVAFVAACATGGWYEGGGIDDEVRGVLRSGPGADLALDVPGGVYAVPAGRLDAERRELLAALLEAEAVPTPGPDGFAAMLAEIEPGPGAAPPPAPPLPADEAIHAWAPGPEAVEIAYPACTVLVRRFEMAGTVSYVVTLHDREFGPDRRKAYRTKLRPSERIDRAWAALVAAADRGATRRHWESTIGEPRPLVAVRDAMVDDRGRK